VLFDPDVEKELYGGLLKANLLAVWAEVTHGKIIVVITLSKRSRLKELKNDLNLYAETVLFAETKTQ
jgi:hypothetical protein